MCYLSAISFRLSAVGKKLTAESREPTAKLCCFRFLEPSVEFFPFGSKLARNASSSHFHRHLGRQVVRKTDDDHRNDFEKRAFRMGEEFHPRGQRCGKAVRH